MFDKLKSKYSDQLYEITKVKNNSVIFKNSKGELFSARKNEVKVVIKPTENIILKAKKQAKISDRQELILRQEEIKESNVIREKMNL